MPFVVKKLKAINTDSLDRLGDSVVDLAKFVEDEFAQVATGLQDTIPDTVWNKPLPRPRRGTYVYADGTHWNPGAGEGPYWFDGTNYNPMGQNSPAALMPVRGYLSGMGMSTPGASTTFTVGAGIACTGSGIDMINLGSAMSKTGAPWVVGSGNGGLDTGSMPSATATWFHVYAIMNTSTGAADVTFSLNPTTPALSGGFNEYRRIGSIRWGTANQWVQFAQVGDEFYWVTPLADFASSAIGTTATLVPLTVPPGFKVNALTRVTYSNSTTAGSACLVQSPDEAVTTPGGVTGNVTLTNANTTTGARATLNVRTDTSGQIRVTTNQASANTVNIATFGWVDHRGRDT